MLSTTYLTLKLYNIIGILDIEIKYTKVLRVPVIFHTLKTYDDKFD